MDNLPVNELKGVIDLDDEIGSGAYGVVKSVSVHGTICAAKDVHKILLQHVSKRESAAVKQKFMQECVHCSKLLHPNIVQFLGIYYPSEHAELPWLIMEKLNTSLTDYVEKRRCDKIYFPVKVSIFYDILLGLQFLHAQKIIHRDLSSNNILLTKFLVAKIADLGMAKLVDPSKIISQSKQPGTPVFMPPEALNDHSKYNRSIDVFSFGCVMIHLMSQEFPYPDSVMCLDKSVGRYVSRSQIECREKYLGKIHKPPGLKKLILESIDDVPDKRPSIIELLNYFEIIVKQQTTQGICLEKDHAISTLQNQLLQELEDEKQAKKDLESQLLQEVEDEKQAKRDLEVKLKKEKEIAAETEELLDAYHIKLQQMRDDNKEKEQRIIKLEAYFNYHTNELSKLEAARKQTIANNQALEESIRDISKSKTFIEEEYQKVKELYEQTKDELHDKETQLAAAKQTINDLTVDNDDLKSTKRNLIDEIGRLIEVDKELEKAEDNLMQAEKELEIKEHQIQTYKEDYEQERKDRENAHNIKEDEIEKCRIEREKLKTEHQAEINTYMQKVNKLTKEIEKLNHDHTKLQTALQKDIKEEQTKTQQITKDNEKLHIEITKLQATLEKERKEAESKADIYKNETEQFQVQWRKREETEKKLKDVTDQLNAVTDQLNTQCRLNTQQQDTINNLLRQSNAKIPANVSGTPMETPNQQQDCQQTTHGAATSHSNQHPSNSSPTITSKYLPHHGPTVAQSNADMTWQQQAVHPGGDVHAGGTAYSQNQLPVNFAGQPLERMNVSQRDHNTVGTDAAIQQDMPHKDDAPRDRLNNPPGGLQAKNPAPVSVGISEEIRVLADLHHNQQHQDGFESGLEYDPYLICHKCNRQFREGQLPEYRHHIDNCRQ